MNENVTVNEAGIPIKVLIDNTEYDIIHENEQMYIINDKGKQKIDIQEYCIAMCLVEPSEQYLQLLEQQRLEQESIVQPPSLEERIQAAEDVITVLLLGGVPSSV